MDGDEFDLRLVRLLTALNDTVQLLRDYGAEHWATSLELDGHRIASGDRGGLEHLVQAFGGMGSLNDLVLCQTPRRPDDPDDDPDDTLSALRSSIYADATALRHHLDGR